MESEFPVNRFFLSRRLLFLCVTLLGFPVSAGDTAAVLRFPVWVMLEAYPGLEQAAEREGAVSDASASSLLAYPIGELKKLAPFIIEGMVYGWNFSYTPSDRARGVDEYFSFEPVARLSASDPSVSYTDVRIEDERLICWVEFRRGPDALRWSRHWESVVYPKVNGRGQGNVSDGTGGIMEAYGQALLDAVRRYARSIEKNKPKEITGSVLLTESPRMYIDGGKYCADLVFYLDITEIIPYRIF